MTKLSSQQLTDELVLSFKNVNGPSMTKASDRSPSRAFRTMRYGKLSFTLDESIYQDFKAGKIGSMTLEESSFKGTDDHGDEVDIACLRFVKAVTKTEILANKRFDAEMNAVEHSVAKEYGLSPEKLKALEAQEL